MTEDNILTMYYGTVRACQYNMAWDRVEYLVEWDHGPEKYRTGWRGAPTEPDQGLTR